MAPGVIAACLVAFHPLRTRVQLVQASGLMLFLLVFAMPGYHPWYQIWYFPFAAVSFTGSLRNAVLLFSLGAFVPLFGFHWRAPIEETLLIPDPMHTLAVLFWGAVLVVLVAPWSRGSPEGGRPAGALRKGG